MGGRIALRARLMSAFTQADTEQSQPQRLLHDKSHKMS